MMLTVISVVAAALWWSLVPCPIAGLASPPLMGLEGPWHIVVWLWPSLHSRCRVGIPRVDSWKWVPWVGGTYALIQRHLPTCGPQRPDRGHAAVSPAGGLVSPRPHQLGSGRSWRPPERWAEASLRLVFTCGGRCSVSRGCLGICTAVHPPPRLPFTEADSAMVDGPGPAPSSPLTHLCDPGRASCSALGALVSPVEWPWRPLGSLGLAPGLRPTVCGKCCVAAAGWEELCVLREALLG